MLALGLLSACSSGCSARDPSSTDTAADAIVEFDTAVDSGATPDDASVDTLTPSEAATDTAVVDVVDAPKFDILGTLAGECGGLAAELAKTSPSLAVNSLVFVPSEYVKASLSVPDGARSFDAENAGGSSGESEVISFEILHYCESASLVKTETEITYAPPDDSGANSITDILVSIGGKKVGVSVTRAYKPLPLKMDDPELKLLLEKKFDGINRSSVRVLPGDK